MTLVLDAILGLTVLEAVVLYLARRRGLLRTLMAGACLMVALRLSLADASPVLILSCLALAGLAHVADLRSRWPASVETR